MTNRTQKLMHHFDEPPSQLNPLALDGSFHKENNFINIKFGQLSPSDLKNENKPPKLLYVREKSQLSIRSRRSNQITPDDGTFYSLLPTQTPNINEFHSIPARREQLPAIRVKSNLTHDCQQSTFVQQEFEIKNHATIAQMDELLITSPIGRLTSGTESFIHNQTMVERKTRGNPLMVYYLVKRFMTKISLKRRQKLFFKADHFKIVNDNSTEKIQSLSDLQSKYMKNEGLICCFGKKHFRSFINKYIRMKNRVITALSKLIKHIPLIYPQAMGKIIWDMILCLVLMYLFVVIPIQICFENNILFIQQPLNIFLIVFLLCDYFIKMNTVYYEYGKPVTDRLMIFQQYMKNGFVIDGLSISVLVIQTLNNASTSQSFNLYNLLLLLFYTQFHYFMKILKQVEESLNLSKVIMAVFGLIKLLFTILFVEHIFSCIWYWVAVFKQRQNQRNWLAEANILNESWETKYLESFYFSTVTMLSVGYGDIVPTNSLEMFLSILFMLFACIQLSYSVNTVGQMINTIQQLEDEGRGKMRVINKYMNENSVSFGLQYQIREYLKTYWLQQVAQESYEEEKILLNLSEGLRNKLIYEANNSVLRSCPLFESHFSSETKIKLLKIMKQIVITPETVITSQISQIGEPCLCFVQLGELNVCLNQQSQSGTIGQYTKGMHFGLETFITGQTPHIQMSSQAFVKLIIITRSDFLKEISEHPHDYEEFCMIKDQFMLKSIDNQDKCKSCKCSGHDIFACPLVHFVVDREKIIKSYQFHQKQPQRILQRSQKRHKNQFSALLDQWAIQEICQVLQNQEQERCYYYDKVNNLYQLQNDQSRPTYDSRPSEGKNLTESKSSGKIFQQRQSTRMGPTSYPSITSIPYVPPLPVLAKVNNKFKTIVRKVVNMLQIPNIKKHLKEISCITNQQKQVTNFNQNIYSQFKKLRKLEEEFIQHKCLSQKEIDDIHFLILKMDLSNLHDSAQQVLFSTKFEIQKDFMLYFPHNNLERVIDTYDKSEPLPLIRQWLNQDPSGKPQILRQNILKVSLTNYMLYPYDYFQKFCKSEEKLKNLIKSPKVQNARLLFQKLKRKNLAQRMKNLSNKIKLMPLATADHSGGS